MRLAGARSDSDRLQQLRAVLPCAVRVIAESHPLFGRLLTATETAQPRPAGDALILDLPVAPTRSLDAYKIAPVADGEATS
jgi:hypothetical protein